MLVESSAHYIHMYSRNFLEGSVQKCCKTVNYSAHGLIWCFIIHSRHKDSCPIEHQVWHLLKEKLHHLIFSTNKRFVHHLRQGGYSAILFCFPTNVQVVPTVNRKLQYRTKPRIEKIRPFLEFQTLPHHCPQLKTCHSSTIVSIGRKFKSNQSREPRVANQCLIIKREEARLSHSF